MGISPDDSVDVRLIQPAVHVARRRAWLCVAAVVLASACAIAWPQWGPRAWSMLALAAVIGLGLIARFGPKKCFGLGLLVIVFALGGAWFTIRTTTAQGSALDQIVGGDDRALIAVHGTLGSDPTRPTPPRDELSRFRRQQSSLVFDLNVNWVERDDGSMARATGILRVRVSTPSATDTVEARFGDQVRVMGWYLPPRGRVNPGEPDHLRWARMTNEVGAIFVASQALITRETTPMTPVSFFQNGLHTVRSNSLHLLEGGDSHPIGRDMLGALLLGEQGPALRETRSAFQQIGTAHLLAISGFHLAVLTGIALLAIRLTGDHGRLEPILAAVLVVGLLLLVPARVPVVRAGIMVLALLGADAIGRRYDRLTILGWITLGLFLWRPLDVFSLGAQLSVGITALLLWVSSSRHPWIVPLTIRGLRRTHRSVFRRALEWLRATTAVCVMCWLISMPIVAAHVGVVSFSGAVTTVLLTPLIIVLLAGGYVSLAIGAVLPSVASNMISGLAWAAELVAGLVNAVAQRPLSSIEVHPPSMLWASAMVVAILVYLKRAKVVEPASLAAIGLLVCFLVVTSIVPRALPRDVALRIDMLSVGDGTCIIVRSGDEALLWDCGSLRNDLVPMLERAQRGLDIRQIRTAMVTHANIDHYLAMPDAIDLFDTDRLLVSPHVLDDDAESVQAFLAAMESKGVEIAPVKAGDRWRFGDATLALLWPIENAAAFKENDQSLVARIAVPTYEGERVVLLVGDIEAPAMEALLLSPTRLQADVLEAPHHGSFHAASQRFVAAVAPRVILQSTGWSRAHDERWDGQKLRSHWLSTAERGALTVEIDKDGTIRTQTMR